MKSKWQLFASIIQLLVGSLAIISFIIIGLNGESLVKWIVALALSITFIILDIVGIADYRSKH